MTIVLRRTIEERATTSALLEIPDGVPSVIERARGNGRGDDNC